MVDLMETTSGNKLLNKYNGYFEFDIENIVYMYVISLTPRRAASFFERFSPFTHTTHFSVPPLSTIVNRFRFDSWGRS